MSSELIESFCQVTGVDNETATSFLSACNNNLEMAVSLFMDESNSAGVSNSEDYRSPIPQRTEQLIPVELPYFAGPIRPLPIRSARRAFVADDSDDNDELVIIGSTNGERRIDLDGGNRTNAPSEHSTAPLPRTRSHRNHQPKPECSSNPRSTVSIVNGDQDAAARKRGHLRQLFQPPEQLLFKGSLSAAQSSAKENCRWLLVSIHDEGCFDCHILNRDVWKDPRVFQTVKKSFTFIQLPVDSPDGMVFRGRYSYVSAASHIAIVDPVSGEQKVMWMHLKDPKTVHEALTEFLQRSQLTAANTDIPPNPHIPSSSSSFRPGQRRPSGEVEATQYALDHPLKRLKIESTVPSSVIVHPLQSAVEDPLSLTEDEQLQLAICASQLESDPKPHPHLSTEVEINGKKSPWPAMGSPGSPIILTDDEDQSPSCDSDDGPDCFILDPEAVSRSSTAIISARRPLRPSNLGSPSAIAHHLAPPCTLPVPAFDEETIDLLIRFPCGSRTVVHVSPSLRLSILRRHLESLGFPSCQYELVRLYPNRSLSDLPGSLTLSDVGLSRKDTVFIQER